jgi:DNA-binding NarL/FixJ family response regulator
MKTTKLIIAESFDIYRLGIKTALEKKNGFCVVGSVKSGKDLIKAYKKAPDSICLISSSIQDANIHEMMKELKKINDKAPVLVISNSTELTHLNQCIKAGVKGYLTKNTSEDELAGLVTSVAAGKQAFSNSVSQLMIGKYTDLTKRTTTADKNDITKREKEVLKLIVDGYTSSEIANILFISTRTVETHRSNIMNKLDLKNTAALVRYAMEEDLS